MQSGAGGKDIIHQQDVFPLYSMRLLDAEGLMEVMAAGLTAESGLRDGGAPTFQEVKANTLLPFWKTGSGQKQGLVEAPFAQALDMERNG